MATAVTNNGRQASGGVSVQYRKTFTDFCAQVRNARGRDLRHKVLGERVLLEVYGTQYKVLDNEVTKTAMGETSGSVGGYLVPTEYSVQLLESMEENSIVYPRANVIPMGAVETRCPVFEASVDQGAGISPFFGGVTFTWGFSQAPTQSVETTFREVTLKAFDLLGYGIMSNQWLQDTGPAGEEKLVKMLGRAAAWSADYAFLRGTGSATLMPLGVLTCPALAAVTRAGGNHIVQADVAKMWAKLMPSSMPRAIWTVTPTAIEDLVKITGFSPNQGNVHEGTAGTIYTRPVFITEKMPPLGTVGDIMLFDPSLYAVGNRQEVLVDISSDEPTTFVTNRSMFRVWMRMAGLPQVNGTVTLADSNTVVSPYVALAA